MITASARITFPLYCMHLWVMFDHLISRWVEIAHMHRETDVRTERGAHERSRPLAYLRTGCMHNVVRCNGPALATVEGEFHYTSRVGLRTTVHLEHFEVYEWLVPPFLRLVIGSSPISHIKVWSMIMIPSY